MKYSIAWWNLENLFEVEGFSGRPEWLAKNLKKELAGWTSDILEQKLTNLALVIKSMNGGNGPDLLGVCEVENESVLQKLISKLNIPGRSYQVVHADTEDQRGIDVAFIFDANQFSLVPNSLFNYVIQKRSATRDILQATFQTVKSNNHFVVLGNHWPSRSGGELESAPYRMMAGETLAYFHERIRSILGDSVPVIAMGDFNDQPFDRSMTHYALSLSNPKKVASSRVKNPYLYNMMWSLMGANVGTHYYANEWGMLDQVLINRALLTRAPLRCKPNDISIFTVPGMVGVNGPIRFSRPSTKGGANLAGFSDHLPVLLTLTEI